MTDPGAERALLVDLGQALYGPGWQYDIADALGVKERRVRYWQAGRPIPPGVWVELRALAFRRRTEISINIGALIAQLPIEGDET